MFILCNITYNNFISSFGPLAFGQIWYNTPITTTGEAGGGGVYKTVTNYDYDFWSLANSATDRLYH